MELLRHDLAPYTFRIAGVGAVLSLFALLIFSPVSRTSLLERADFSPTSSWDSINLAIVMPFVTSDVISVTQGLQSWQAAPPCSGARSLNWWGKPTFWFYSNKELELADREVIQNAVRNLGVSLNCIKAFRFISASIPKELDHYNPDSKDSGWVEGPNTQFYQLLANNTGILPTSTSHVFLMEPDTRPVRPHWVAHLHSTIKINDPFWIRGSAFRGPCVSTKTHWESARPDCHQLRDVSGHINGNALYSIGDPSFREFLTEVRASKFAKWPFDLAWYKLLNEPGSEVRRGELSSNFVYTDLIRNYGASEFDLSKLLEESPWTYFIHSDELNQPIVVLDAFKKLDAGTRKTARQALSPELLVVLDQQATAKGDILLTFVSGNYIEMASNFIYFAARAEINNLVLVAMDGEAFTWGKSVGIPTHAYYGNASAETVGSDAYGSDGFNQIVNRRTKLIATILRAGFSIMASDVDIVWLKNPFNFFLDEPYIFEAQSDARFGYVEDDPTTRQFPQFVNAGCFYARATPRAADLFDIWSDSIEQHPEWNDQQALNHVLQDNLLRIKFRILDPVLFSNGFVYFNRMVSERTHVQPFAIHNNWIEGGEVKKYRFREAGLWVMDPPSYFDKAERKYLSVSEPRLEDNDWDRVRNSIRAGIAISTILNRTFILPKIYSHRNHPETVTLDHYLNMMTFMNRTKNFRVSSFSEKVFPEGPSHLFEIDTGSRSMANEPTVPVVRFVPKAGRLGATDIELRQWFGPYANEPLIQLTDLYERFHKVEDTKKTPPLGTLLWGIVQPPWTLQVPAKAMKDVLFAKAKQRGNETYNCAQIFKGPSSALFTSGSADIIEILTPRMNPAEVVYIVTDLDTPTNYRKEIKKVYPHAYFREDFEYITSKFRDAELGTSMGMDVVAGLVCVGSLNFVGDVESTFVNNLCVLRKGSGLKGDTMCKDIFDRPWLGSH